MSDNSTDTDTDTDTKPSAKVPRGIKVFGIAGVLLLGLLTGFYALLPQILVLATEYLVGENTPFRIEVGSYELSSERGELIARDLHLSSDQGTGLTIDELRIDAAITDYLKGKSTTIKSVSLRGVHGKIEWDGEDVLLAGVNLAEVQNGGYKSVATDTPSVQQEREQEQEQEQEQEEGQAPESAPTRLTIESVRIADLTVEAKLKQETTQLYLEDARMNNFALHRPNLPTRVEIKGKLETLQFAVKGEVFPLAPEETSDIEVELSKMDLARMMTLAAQFKEDLPDLEGTLTSTHHIKYSQQADQTQLTASSNVALSELSYRENGHESVTVERLVLKEFKIDLGKEKRYKADEIKALQLLVHQPEQDNKGTIDVLLKGLDLRDKNYMSRDSPGSLTLNTGFGNYGTVSVQMTSKPAGEGQEKTTKAKLEAIDLTSLSGFFEDQIGYQIRNGQVNADLKTKTSADDQIDGNFDLTISKIDLDNETAEGKEIESKSSMPLATAFDLVKDKNGLIELNFPITGHADDPSFSPRVILTSALGSIILDQLIQAAGEAVIATYLPALISTTTLSPGMILTLVKSGVDFATKLRFAPVPFALGKSTLDQKGRDQLDKIAKVLLPRKDVAINFCPVAYPFELSEPSESIGDELAKQTLVLARSRLANVTNYLIKVKKLKPTQVVACKPKITDDDDDQGLVAVYF